MRSPRTKARGALVPGDVKLRHSSSDFCLAVVAGVAWLAETNEKMAARRLRHRNACSQTQLIPRGFGVRLSSAALYSCNVTNRRSLASFRRLITQKFIQFRPGLHLPKNIFLRAFRA